MSPSSTLDANQGIVPRRLTTILDAGAANSSGLAAHDEAKTLPPLARRNTSMDAPRQAHEYRRATTAGKRVLAEFPSTVRAERAAVSMPRALAAGTPAAAHAPLEPSGRGEPDRLEGHGSSGSRPWALVLAGGRVR